DITERGSSVAPKGNAFDGWFNGSQAANPDGTPKVMYHTTMEWEQDGRKLGDFDVFDRNASVSIVGRKESRDTVGSWFSDEPGKDGSDMYSSDQHAAVYPVYLSIKNPWRPRSWDQLLTVFHRVAGRSTDQKPKG